MTCDLRTDQTNPRRANSRGRPPLGAPTRGAGGAIPPGRCFRHILYNPLPPFDYPDNG